ncbi:FAD-binding oxidoreductase [Fertoebacter nigrum]|uniref:FAD-binding oxidoreductase n=1 Tax=Fertoeibacter niger TaxID=2656921 RepID=A0A8X8KQ74_9RHOB|nr:FAD-dependent oxidoreductase [Fertoeibacter niger]NUB45900.1 FAD-binding oxidoreductase [Fertoeibacter niger]
MDEAEIAVIGGGIVALSVAVGLRRLGRRVVVLDEGDSAIRASRGNFGLVWVQGKGDLLPIYTPWAMGAVEIWPELAEWLQEFTGIDVSLEQLGGLYLCRSEADLALRAAKMASVAANVQGSYRYSMLDNKALRALVPQVGPEVAGGSYSPYDGQADPLRLFHALHRAYRRLGGHYLPGAGVASIATTARGYSLDTGQTRIAAERIVLAAGLGNAALGRMLGVEVPVKPVRGQILVTERVPKVFDLVMEQARHTPDGTMLIGGSWEEGAGHDTATSHDVTRRIASDAQAFFPFLKGVNILRSWGALRIITPDASPIYDEVAPGAFLVTCHSGVSLAAVHMQTVAGWVDKGAIPAEMADFGLRRFGNHHEAAP